jgi:lipopolysaccharide transport system permease protein
MRALIQLTKEIYAYRELLFALTYRDIRVKYKQAVMGVMWVFFMPVLAICSGLIFRLAMSLFSGRPLEVVDIVSVMVKSVPWLLFASIVGGASNSLLGNIGLITKIYFPREIVPLASVLTALFDFVVSVTGLILVLTLLVLFTDQASPPIALTLNLLWVPVLLGVLLLLATALGFLLSCANLFFRDVKYITQVMLQFGIMFSLVYFSYQELGRWGWVFLLNPVTPLLEAMRSVVIQGQMDPYLWPWLGYSTSLAVVGFLAASAVFERAEYLFAEYA